MCQGHFVVIQGCVRLRNATLQCISEAMLTVMISRAANFESCRFVLLLTII